MTDPDELGRTLTALAGALDALKVRWAVGGSIASAAHGEPRATNDVGVIATLSVDQASSLVVALQESFYADIAAAQDAVRRNARFNLIDQTSFIKVDVFVPAPGPLGIGQLDRIQILDLVPGTAPLPVLAAEDIVLQKLRWYRLGGEVSERQWRDVVSVLRFTTDLDLGYLTRTAESAGLSSLLERALGEAAS